MRCPSLYLKDKSLNWNVHLFLYPQIKKFIVYQVICHKVEITNSFQHCVYLHSVTATRSSRKHTRMYKSGLGASTFASSLEVACEDSRLLPSGEEQGKTAVFTGYSQRGRRRCVLYLLGISVCCHFSGRFWIVHSCCTFVYCGVDNVDQFKLL